MDYCLKANTARHDGLRLGRMLLALSIGSVATTELLAETDYSANIEIDTDYISSRVDTGDNDFDVSGAVELSVTGEHDIDETTVLSGVGEVLIQTDGEVDVEDAYLRIGQETWGLRFGRYEAIDMFSAGADTLVLTWDGVANYEADAAQGQFDEAGQIGLELLPSERITLHLDAVWGEADDEVVDEDAVSGFRPVAVLDLTDDLRLTAGLDYLKEGDSKLKGGGIYLRYATDAFALRMNYASSTEKTGDVTDSETSSYNVNLEFSNVGLGFQRSEDETTGASGDSFYAQYLFRNLAGNENADAQLGISALSVDPAVGETVADDTEYGVRLRLYYEF